VGCWGARNPKLPGVTRAQVRFSRHLAQPDGLFSQHSGPRSPQRAAEMSTQALVARAVQAPTTVLLR
jgi:hypothetical protein